MPKNTQKQYRYTQNRELSWLRFNRRVLEEAADTSVPALERLKFVSIFSSNLDEFFMVRVGSLFDLARMTPNDSDNKTGWTPAQQLHHVYRAIPGLLAIKKQICAAVMETLAKEGIQDASIETLDAGDLKQVNRFFKTELLPVLSPIVIAPNHLVPHLVNKNLYAAALLESKKRHKAIGIVPVPESTPPYLLLSDGIRFVRTENILLRYLPTLFDAYTVKESCVLAVTRNADISFDDEKFEDDEEDFRRQMKKLLKQRDHLAVVRLELSAPVSAEFQRIPSSLVRVENHQIFVDATPLNMRYVFRLIGELPREVSSRLLYPSYHPRWAEDLRQNQSILAQVQQKDRLLFYPYDSVEPFLRLLNEAAENPQVLSIKITIYRLASSSRIAQTLCRAAENGKEVLVLMELRACFDEENNLAWSKMLAESGCQVIYGTEGFKCHSKICLITLRNRNKTTYLTQIGTGNYNEKTNAMYTDLCLMTADQTIGEDAASFFRNMLVNKLDGEYRQLCVSPFGVKSIYALYLQGCGQKEIARRLNSLGRKTPAQIMTERLGYDSQKPHKTRDGQFLWTYASVKNVLTEEAYTGVLVNHRREYLGGKARAVSETDWLRHENFYPVIIERAVWQQVQTRLRQQARPAVNNRTKHRYAGLLTCRECGNTFIPMIRCWNGSRRVEYVCRGYHRNV